MSEQWRSIPDFPRYEASSQGRIRNARTSRILSQSPMPNGYPKVGLRRDGQTVTRPVHSLIAATFIGHRPAGQDVRHLDGTRTNNAVANLAYGTRSENTYDAIRHNTHANARKTHCPAGHPYDVVTDRARSCSTCVNARACAKYRERKAAA